MTVNVGVGAFSRLFSIGNGVDIGAGFDHMAHTKNHRPRSTTPPKGRPTQARADAVTVKRDTVTLQWTAVGLAIVGIIGGLIYFGGDWGGDTVNRGGGGHGAPAVVEGSSFVGLDRQAG